jgi:hypothetical protein
MFITIERNVDNSDLEIAVKNFIARLNKLKPAERSDILDDLDYMISSDGTFLILLSDRQGKLLLDKKIIKENNNGRTI